MGTRAFEIETSSITGRRVSEVTAHRNGSFQDCLTDTGESAQRRGRVSAMLDVYRALAPKQNRAEGVAGRGRTRAARRRGAVSEK